ncbi:anti-repressor SinI family protein [Ferroacidibacillus organovorans]|uniref:Sin domain-containing protein n=1 Tax=Ferroacidibacillus organovorans TaxID=1765683 RepID=A0A162U2Y6_9BACL|nr:anti-repressor SinI family protein [Ferroacidibacillus organovorans]KYP81361.1 hypothetical protein AYJ22_00930 [Ferroacidibacillus organovorans]OAG95148.1 hypothetical protein AYW79_01530 [Ferroacidibacillus organovorans]OPG15139.1 hypothetical protein B2M26_13385 [Ferroacidibacillus organovorans]
MSNAELIQSEGVDVGWISLMKEAKTLGLSLEEVRIFLYSKRDVVYDSSLRTTDTIDLNQER